MEDYEIQCSDCGWCGYTADRKENEFGEDCCPECGSTDIVDFENEDEDEESDIDDDFDDFFYNVTMKGL